MTYDFLVVSCGESLKEANRDHDKDIDSFLHRCAEKGVRLNPDKVNLRLLEIPLCRPTSEGLCERSRLYIAVPQTVAASSTTTIRLT